MKKSLQPTKLLAALISLFVMLTLAAPASAFIIHGGASAQLPPTARNIASAARAPGFNGTDPSLGTVTNQNGRAAFVNESGESISNVAVIYSGWYTDGTNEIDNPNDYTVYASVEYPAGTYTQVRWASATSYNVLPGENKISDYINLTEPIPAGQRFWVRTFVVVDSGEIWPLTSNLWNSEAGELGTGLVDKTMSGTISGSSVVLRPSAILATTNARLSVAAIGNSIVAGAGDGNFDNYGNIGGFARSCSNLCPMLNIAVSGTQARYQVGNISRRIDLMQKAGITHVITDWGGNDLAASRTKDQILADELSLATSFTNAGMRAIQTTITPSTQSTDGWQTVASQTITRVGYTGGTGSVRAALNTDLRTKPAPLYDVIDLANAMDTSEGSGIWGVGSTFSPYLGPVDNWVVGSGSTSTVITSNANRATDYYRFGGAIVFTSGALTGQRQLVSANTSGGTFTVSSAFTGAPSPGDTFTAYPRYVAPTGDGIHPNVTSSSLNYGGHIIILNVLRNKWLTY